MDKIVLTTELKGGLTNSILQRMVQIYATTPGLSRRSENELRNLYNKRKIIFAQSGPKPVGWLIRSPLSNAFWEISGGYVSEEFRSKGIFKALLHKAMEPRANYIIVTFLSTFANYLIERWNFHRITLVKVLYFTGGTFILDRLHPSRIISIVQQFKKGRPIYLIRSDQQYE